LVLNILCVRHNSQRRQLLFFNLWHW